MFLNKQSHIWVIVLALLMVWGALLFRLDEPFWGMHENPPTWMSAAVRTFNQYGPAAVNFMVVRTPGPTTPETGHYYLHHPPLIIWIEALVTPFFGYDAQSLAPYEATIRMVAIIATMLTLALFYVIARRLSNAHGALIAFLIYACTPLTLYFGRAPHYDIMLMPFVYAFIAIFINWMRHYSQARTIALTLVAITMMWIDWPGAFYLAAMGLFALVLGGRRQRLGIVVIGGITLAATAIIPAMYAYLRPGSLNDIVEILSLRTSQQDAGFDSEAFTLSGFAIRYFYDMVTIISLSATILGAIGLMGVLLGKKTRARYLLLTLAITPYVFMAIVPNSFHFHNWYKVHFLPSYAIGAALLIMAGWQIAPTGFKRYIKPLIVAILITSVGLTLFWTARLHQTSIDNTFGRSVAADLPQYTEEDDLIYSNATANINKIEYYAYRTVQWGIDPAELATYVEEQATMDAYYLLCDTVYSLPDSDGAFASYPGQPIGDDCRLIHLLK